MSSSSERSLSFISVVSALKHGESGMSPSKLSTGDTEDSEDRTGTLPKTTLAEATACCSLSVSRGASCPDGGKWCMGDCSGASCGVITMDECKCKVSRDLSKPGVLSGGGNICSEEQEN